MAVEAENKARKHGNTCPEGVGGVQGLKSARCGHMNIISLCLRRFFAPKVAHTHRKIVILHCFPVVFVRVYERQSCLQCPKALFTAVLWAYIWIFECERLYLKIWNRLWRQESTIRSYGEIAILHCFLVVFLRTYERQSCLEWLRTLFGVVLAGQIWILSANGSIFPIWNRPWRRKSTMCTYGNRRFPLFPGHFSKDIWEAKLFGVVYNIV